MKQRQGYMYGIALFGLLFLAGPAFAQDTYQQPTGGQCQSPQFFCGSLNRCANAEECNAADKAGSTGGTNYQQPTGNYQSPQGTMPYQGDMKPCAAGQQPSPTAPCLMEGGYKDMMKQPTDQSQNYQMPSSDMQKQYQQQYDPRMQDKNFRSEDTRWEGTGKQPGDRMMNGGMQDEFQGPSEEDMQKQEARMNEQRFQQMKRGLSQFKNGVKGMKKGVLNAKKNLGKCGVSLPEELTTALDKSDSIVQKLDAAKTADELDEIISDVEDVGGVMQEWGPKLGDLFRVCEMMKRSDADYKRMERDVNRVVKQANAAKKKIDLSEMADGLKQELAKLKEAKEVAKTLAKTDPEEALEKLDDEFYGEFETLNNARQEIETVLNVTKGLRDGKNEVKRYDSQLKALKRKKKDTSELEADIKDIKQKLAELESFMKQKGVKADDIIERVEELFDLREEFLDKLNELRGGSEFEPQIKSGPSFDFRLPQGFERQEAPEGAMQGGGEMMQNF